MLVRTMSHEEAANEARKDIRTVARKAVYHAKEIEKKLKKAKQKSYDATFDYKSPRGNNWFYRLQFSGTSHRKIEFNAMFACWHLTSKGMRVLLVERGEAKNFNHIKIYTSHMFDRYVERMGLTGFTNKLDVVKYYLDKYDYSLCATGQLPDSDDDRIVTIYNTCDGIELGNTIKSHDMTIINTFITQDMAKGNQRIMADLTNALVVGDITKYRSIKDNIKESDHITIIESE